MSWETVVAWLVVILVPLAVGRMFWEISQTHDMCKKILEILEEEEEE